MQVEWHEDLRKVLKMAGEANKRVVFLFADTQIKSESFVEDISNLLNTYEVPNLLQPADLATTFETIRPRAKAAGMDGTKDQLYSFFLQEVCAFPFHSCKQILDDFWMTSAGCLKCSMLAAMLLGACTHMLRV